MARQKASSMPPMPPMAGPFPNTNYPSAPTKPMPMAKIKVPAVRAPHPTLAGRDTQGRIMNVPVAKPAKAVAVKVQKLPPAVAAIMKQGAQRTQRAPMPAIATKPMNFANVPPPARPF